MPRIVVTNRAGERRSFDADARETLMEALRAGGVDELVALCGGNCSCATCHVYVIAGGPDLPPMSQDEDDLLDSSDARRSDSRLSCQIPLSSAREGLTVIVAPED